MDSSTKRNRGAALVMTLLIIAALAGLAVGFSDESGIELELSGYAGHGNRARQIALSGCELALALLDQDENLDMDSLREEWGRFGPESFPEPLPETVLFSGRIRDESGKININSLLNELGRIDPRRERQVVRLFAALGLEENFVDPVLDWLDADDIERMEGAENYYYRSLKAPYDCFNGPFMTTPQVFLVRNMSAAHHILEKNGKSLLDFVTVHSEGKVNINTASSEVLQSLDGEMDASLAASIIDYRAEEDFLSTRDLSKVPGIGADMSNRISEWITVKSSAFRVEVEVAYQEAIARINAVAVRKEGKSKLVCCRVM